MKKDPLKNFEPSIEAIDVEKLVDSDNNHKEHSDESVAKLAKSMASLGQIQPVITDKDHVIIAGHGRRMAAVSLGWKKIKVIRLPVDEMTARKMRIADNLVKNDNVNVDVLAKEIRELSEALEEDVEMILDEVISNDREQDLTLNAISAHSARELDELTVSVTDDVSALAKEGEENVQKTDKEEVTLSAGLGFSKFRIEDIRTVKHWIALMKSKTGISDPREAFLAVAKQELKDV